VESEEHATVKESEELLAVWNLGRRHLRAGTLKGLAVVAVLISGTLFLYLFMEHFS
jgi:hypothetical protein